VKRIILAGLVIILLAGCEFSARRAFSNPAAPTTEQGNILSGGFVSAMKAGKTTREQEQAHILTLDAEFLAVDGATRGTAAAAATRALVTPAAPAVPAPSSPAAPAASTTKGK